MIFFRSKRIALEEIKALNGIINCCVRRNCVHLLFTGCDSRHFDISWSQNYDSASTVLLLLLPLVLLLLLLLLLCCCYCCVVTIVVIVVVVTVVVVAAAAAAVL